jgi:hypothetical protein
LAATDERFDKLPDLIRESIREGLFLGVLPARAARELLEPLLSRYDELMPRLAFDLQEDVVRILGLYPELAREYGISLQPPLLRLLCSFRESLERRGVAEAFTDEAPLDAAAESQQPLGEDGEETCKSGKGFLLTEKGTSVLIAATYLESEEMIHFECRNVSRGVYVYLCGRYAFSFDAERPEAFLTLRRFMEFFAGKSQSEMKIEVREEKI